MKQYKEYYFKAGQNISGIDIGFENEIINCEFLSCDFHPNTYDTRFIDCVFINCNISEYDLKNAENCLFFQF